MNVISSESLIQIGKILSGISKEDFSVAELEICKILIKLGICRWKDHEGFGENWQSLEMTKRKDD
jgi:hypothetical protein